MNWPLRMLKNLKISILLVYKKIILLYLGSAIKLTDSPENYKKSFIEGWIHPDDGYKIRME